MSTRPAFISVAEAAEVLGVGRQTAYELIKRGEFPIPVVKLGRRLKVRTAELDRFVAGEAVTEAAS